MINAWAAMLLLSPFFSSPATGWLDAGYNYRVTITVDAGFYDRTDCLVRLPLRIDEWAGRKAEVHDALRLYEVTKKGKLIAETPAALSADGSELRWIVSGRTECLSKRYYQLYFDTAASAPRLPDYSNAPPEPAPLNLLLNPGFEQASPTDPRQAAGWTFHGGPDLIVERSDEQAHTGRYSLKVVNHRGGNTAASASQFVAQLLPGKRYLVSGWVKIVECESGSATVTTWYSARKGERLPGNYKSQAGTRGVCDWLKIETTRIVYYDAEHKEHVYPPVTLQCTGGGRFEIACCYGILTAYFDDLRLVEWSRDILSPPTATVGRPQKRS